MLVMVADAHEGGPYFFEVGVGLKPYSKHHLTIAQCIAHLSGRGLTFPVPGEAESALKEIGHDRLRIYLSSRRDNSASGKPFQTGITFSDILDIYRFDEKLRMLLFNYCSRIEVIFKNSISETLSEKIGPHPYYSDAAFRSQKDWVDSIIFISGFMTTRSMKDTRARHYFNNYNAPSFPPIWTLKEFLTFGKALQFYNFLSDPIQTAIARRMGLPSRGILHDWLVCIVDVRNICAHHNRLFNRNFQKAPEVLRKSGIPSVANANSVAAIAECIEFIIGKFDPSCGVCAEILALITSHPSVQRSEVGF